MKSTKSVLGAVAAVALVAVILTLAVLKKERPGVEVQTPRDAPAAEAERPARKSTAVPAAGEKGAARSAAGEKRSGQPEKQQPLVPGKGAAGPTAAAAAEERTEARTKAVEAWESFIDEVAERTAKPTAEQALQFKEAFHRLDKADQMDGIQTALNLLPDEQFSLMYPILFDKTENADVLDEIFSDGLNRDEDIKVPMMKELYKDKEHPMFVEAARILDATGELDEMNGEKEEKEE